MIKGLYSAASAMVAAMRQQEVLTHNITNIDTAGFKEILIGIEKWEDTAVLKEAEEETSLPTPNFPSLFSEMSGAVDYKGVLGLGAYPSDEKTNWDFGPLQSTNLPLDLAIQGEGFFRLQTPEGVRYTRDGRFTRDATGTLVSVDGYRLLGEDGQPVVLPVEAPDDEINIQSDGSIVIGTDTVAKIGTVAFEDPETALIREKDNLFSLNGDPAQITPGDVQQGYLESSNVNTAQVVSQMMVLSRYYEAAQTMVRTQDELLGRAISTLGLS